jgi:alpha-1,6-mannosyltransferase
MRLSAVDFFLDLCLFLVVAAHVVLVPYTKVEESFNLQATHDVMYHGWALENYDHHQFPGVVPRTCLGAVCLALLTKPVHLFAIALGVSPSDEQVGTKMHAQIACRLVLASVVVASLGRFRRVLGTGFGKETGFAFGVLSATQFHLPFYASRTLPNTFALVLTTFALADWLDAHCERLGYGVQSWTKPAEVRAGEDDWKMEKVRKKNLRAVFLLTLVCVVFRCDVALLLAPVGVHMIITNSLSIKQAVTFGGKSVVAALVLTIAADAAFWAPRARERYVLRFPNPGTLFAHTRTRREHYLCPDCLSIHRDILVPEETSHLCPDCLSIHRDIQH